MRKGGSAAESAFDKGARKAGNVSSKKSPMQAFLTSMPLAKRKTIELDRTDTAGGLPRMPEDLKREMKEAADKLEFERAAELRDRIREL